jgi:hypothetical protein
MFGMPNIDGAFELSIDGNAPEPQNGEVSSTLEFRGQSPCAAMRQDRSVHLRNVRHAEHDGGLRAVDRRQRSGSDETARGFDTGIPRATSLCGYEGGIVPSTPAMFGMPNTMEGSELPIDRNASGAAKRGGELDVGIPRAKSLCGYEGRID